MAVCSLTSCLHYEHQKRSPPSGTQENHSNSKHSFHQTTPFAENPFRSSMHLLNHFQTREKEEFIKFKIKPNRA